MSNHNLDEIKLADQILGEAGFRVEAVQNHYSLLYRSSEKAGILDYCREHDIQFFAYMVLEQGALTGKYSPDNPLPEGSSRAEIYNDLLPQAKSLTDKLADLGSSQEQAQPMSPRPGQLPRARRRSSASRSRNTSTASYEQRASP